MKRKDPDVVQVFIGVLAAIVLAAAVAALGSGHEAATILFLGAAFVEIGALLIGTYRLRQGRL